MFLQYATDEPFLNGNVAKQYFAIVSEPKKLKVCDAPHARNIEATHERIAFLAEELSFNPHRTPRRWVLFRLSLSRRGRSFPNSSSARRTAAQ